MNPLYKIFNEIYFYTMLENKDYFILERLVPKIIIIIINN